LTVRRGAWVALALSIALACTHAPRHEPHFLPVSRGWPVPLPPGFQAPPTPPDNPISAAKVDLGRHLFFDVRLSHNATESCASCHQPEHAFTDGRRHAVGSTGEEHYRNTMSLTNVGYRSPLTWADRDVVSLEAQALIPLTNCAPVEMGMADHFDEIVSRLRADAKYRGLFAAAFPDEPEPITVTNAARAVASFERTIISGNSPYDRLLFRGDSNALSPEAWRGMRLFFSARLRCGECHAGRDLSSPRFENTNLYEAPADQGLRRQTHRTEDTGKFRVPSLRNVAVTAPYMHDCSATTLADVIDDYAAGGRAARIHGKRAPRGVNIRPFTITDREKQDLVAFLESLTDDEFLHDPRLRSPWPQ